MNGITLTLTIAAIFSVIVFLGNLWYCVKNKQPHNWMRGLLMAGAAFILVTAIGVATE